MAGTRGWLVAGGVGVVTYAVTGETLLLLISVLMIVGVWYGCFFLAHREVRAAKVAGGWYEGQRQGIAVDTGLRTDPPRFPWLWLAPALIVTLTTVVIGVITYPSMPQMLAVHYRANGVPTRLAAKSVGTAFSLVFVQIGVTALLVGIAPPSSSAAGPTSTQRARSAPRAGTASTCHWVPRRCSGWSR